MSLKDGVLGVQGGFDLAGFERTLTGYSVQSDVPDRPTRFRILDCHDQSIQQSGRVLIETGGTLRLLSDSGVVAEQKTRGLGKFLTQIPDGPVKTALKGFPPLRAFITLAEGQISNQTIQVLDDLEKTQARLNVSQLRSADGQAALVTVRHLRGYDKAFAETRAALAGLQTGTGMVHHLHQLLCPGRVPYQAKPDVELGKTEPAIQAATDIIRIYLGVARQNEAGVIADIDTEFLHDYRVSLRKIRSVVSLFKGVFSEAQTAEFKRIFSDLMGPTGKARDLDVYLLEKDLFFRLIPEKLHLGAQKMFAQFEVERKKEISALAQRFRSRSYDKEMRGLIDLFADTQNLDPGPNAQLGAYEYACALIWKRYRKVCKLARSITHDTPDQAVHDLRIDCKKLRYLMEFFGPLFDARDFKTLIKPLKKLQDNLGLFNDYAVQQEALLTFIDTHSTARGQADAQLSMAVGGIVAVLNQRQKAERDRVIDSFRQFDSTETRTLFRRLFHLSES